MALANTPTASPMIEADPNYGSTFEEEDDYRSRRKYWYQLRPGDHLIPLLALTPHHPLLTGGPIEPQTPSNSFSSYDSTNVDGSSSTISSPTSQGSQPGSPFTSSSQPAGLPKNTVAVPPPALEPPPDRQRCEVWPISYRSADGWLKTCWCIQIDGEPSYQYRPPDFHALSTRYHLVYPPPLATTTAPTTAMT